MNHKQKIKILIDFLMFITLMLLMPYEMVGETAHEWLGMGMFVLFISHHVMNRKWTKSVVKGTYTPIRLMQTVLVIAMLVLMIGSMLSGIVISRHIFKDVHIMGINTLAGSVHMICAYWGFVLMAVHLGLHWNIFMKMIESWTGKWRSSVRWLLRISVFAIAGSGVYAFSKRDIASYMLLRSHFVFFDYTDSLGNYMLDYLAIMILFIVIGHYLAMLLRGKLLKE